MLKIVSFFSGAEQPLNRADKSIEE